MTTSREECPTSPAEAHSMSLDAATQVSAVLRALAEPLRLRMLSFIATEPTGEACVCDIATVADVAQPTVSHHLKVLKSVGVLVSERRGTWVYYRIAPNLRGAVSTLLDAFAPAVLASGVAPQANAVRLTQAGVGSSSTSVAWDAIPANAASVRLTFDFRMSADAGSEAADGFGDLLMRGKAGRLLLRLLFGDPVQCRIDDAEDIE